MFYTILFFTPDDYYTRRCLHPKPLTSKSFFTQVFGPNDFTTEDVYTSNHLRQRPFTLDAFYSRGTSHQRAFTLHRICLRRTPLTPNRHCASKSFYTTNFVTNKFYTRNLFQDVETTNLSHQSILTPDDFDSKDALCTRGLLHQ